MILDGGSILYGAATGLERALVDVDGRRLSSVPAWLIRENLDPWKVQSGTNLAYLAWGYGVTLWESSWTEDWQRQWLAEQNEFKARVGTLGGIRMALTPSGYVIKDVVRPPAGFFASPDLSADEMDSWIRLMPQIRIKFASKEGEDVAYEWFADDSFSDDSTVGLDDGPVLWGRKGVLRAANGTETPLEMSVETVRQLDGQLLSFERYGLPAFDHLAFFADEDGSDHAFVITDGGARTVFSAIIDPTNDRQITSLSLTALDPGLLPLTPRYERNSDIGEAGPALFSDDGCSAFDFVDPDLAPEMLADRVYLFDPAIAAPLNAGVSFAGVDRVGMPVKVAELLIDLGTKDDTPATYESDNIVGETFATPEDSSDIDRALRAVVAGKALSQTVHVSFEAFRPVAAGDLIRESTKAGEWLPALL